MTKVAHHTRNAICAFLLAQMAFSCPAFANMVDTPDCRREIFFTDGGMVASQRKLQDNAAAKPAELCAVWRQHLTVLNKAIIVYKKCASAGERATKLGPAQTSQGEFTEVIKNRCKDK